MKGDAMDKERHYVVGIREVHISYREVPYQEGLTHDEAKERALEDVGLETSFEYSHTMDKDNHSVEGPFDREPAPEVRRASP